MREGHRFSGNQTIDGVNTENKLCWCQGIDADGKFHEKFKEKWGLPVSAGIQDAPPYEDVGKCLNWG